MNVQALIAFIGGGNMTHSLVNGLIASGYTPSSIRVSDPHPEKRQAFQNQFGVEVTDSNIYCMKNADILVLAVKPQDVKNVTLEIKNSLPPKTLILSIAAGISTELLGQWLGSELPIVRAMPNTPALVQVGATGLYANTRTSEEQKSQAESLLRSVGIVAWVNHEHDMDTITAISGSGPAYFFLLMQALQHSAENLGLNSQTAKLLTLQTAVGAAKMALESNLSLEQLIEKVTSKGGTTEQALAVFESGHFNELIKKAVMAAKDRAQDITRHFK